MESVQIPLLDIANRENDCSFKLFLRRIRQFPVPRNIKVDTIDHVDFVLILKKKSVSSPSAEKRASYLNTLSQVYLITYRHVVGKTYDFYLIHLSYYHLGLLAEIFRYQWQVKTRDPNKVAYDTFNFFNWAKEGRESNFLNYESRADFSQRIRYDLAYKFLSGIAISLGSETGTGGCCGGKTGSRYDLRRVLNEKLFDDWMVPHTPDLRLFLAEQSTLKNALLKHYFPRAEKEKTAGADLFHIIPVHQINDYVGEKIGFYFAWAELLVMTLSVPAVLGAVMFIALVIYYYTTADNNEATFLGIFEKACDNYATPVFACLTVIWGTCFHELWKRRQAWYRFLWNVGDLDVDEWANIDNKNDDDSLPPERPLRRVLPYTISTFVTLLFIGVLSVSIYLINIVNVFSFDDNCHQQASNTTQHDDSRFICNFSSIAQVTANSVSVFVLNVIYTSVAYKLTDWEAHSKPSHYRNALVLKLFIFKFFNFYSVLFYTAFGSRILSHFLPDEANIGCGGQPCILKLTKQLFGLLVTQPLFYTMKGFALPFLKSVVQLFKARRNNDNKETGSSPAENGDLLLINELEKQANLLHLSPLDKQQFTADEFTQRIITFGALLMFSVALPPAAAMTIIFMRLDLTLDVRRIVTHYKRPIPDRASGIGLWGGAVYLLTYLGLITNPLIVVLTSTWGSQFDTWWKFWIFIIFEHVTIALRAFVAAVIPDMPQTLEKETYRRQRNRQELIDDSTK